MAGATAIVNGQASFAAGQSFDARMIRLATLMNTMPGVYAPSGFVPEFQVSGAFPSPNMGVTIQPGRAIVTPNQAAHQGSYAVRMAAQYNTLTNGGYTWTAAPATGARVDLVCIEVKDHEMDASGLTGWRFRIVDGTITAATHPLHVAAWPAIPTGCVPIGAVLVAAGDTTISSANVAYLPVYGGGRPSRDNWNSTDLYNTLAGATSPNVRTRSHVMVYVPHNRAVVRIHFKAHMTGTGASLMYGINMNGAILTYPANGTIPQPSTTSTILSATNLSQVCTYTNGIQSALLETSTSGALSDVTTGMLHGKPAAVYQSGPIYVTNVVAGWHLFEFAIGGTGGVQSNISVKEPRLVAEVIG